MPLLGASTGSVPFVLSPAVREAVVAGELPGVTDVGVVFDALGMFSLFEVPPGEQGTAGRVVVSSDFGEVFAVAEGNVDVWGAGFPSFADVKNVVSGDVLGAVSAFEGKVARFPSGEVGSLGCGRVLFHLCDEGNEGELEAVRMSDRLLGVAVSSSDVDGMGAGRGAVVGVE